ncbi:MAG: SGNH/GDSL hydrolase family protein [Pirellulaceae bacterium]
MQKPQKPRRIRLVILFCTGVLLVLAAVSYNSLFLARPIGEGPAGPQVDRAQFSEVWTERNILLLGVGDSITAGLGAKSPQHSYFERMRVNPVDEYEDMSGSCLSHVIPNLTAKNVAVSGSTSIQHLDILSGDLLTPWDETVFGMVVVTTGGNDIIHSYGRSPPREGAMYGATLAEATPWIENFAQRLEQMLDKIESLFPGGCEIYLADIYDPTDGVGDAPSVFLPPWPDGLAIHAAYNERLRTAAAERSNVFSIPLHQTFLGHGSHCRQFWREHYDRQDPHYWFYDNIEDPNDRGYDAIRRVFLNKIADHTQLRNR